MAIHAAAVTEVLRFPCEGGNKPDYVARLLVDRVDLDDARQARSVRGGAQILVFHPGTDPAVNALDYGAKPYSVVKVLGG